MLGFIKKDLFMIKANLKTFLIIFALYIVLAIQGSFDITFVIPLIGIMLFITTFSYDDYNNWNAYVATIPNGRRNAVRAKYVVSIILMIVLGIISFGMAVGVDYFIKNQVYIDQSLSSVLGILLSIVIIISLLYPIMFKFGSTNGRVILFVVVFGFAAIIGFVANYTSISFNTSQIKELLEKYVYIAIPMVSVILLMISYLISSKIYRNKEF